MGQLGGDSTRTSPPSKPATPYFRHPVFFLWRLLPRTWLAIPHCAYAPTHYSFVSAFYPRFQTVKSFPGQPTHGYTAKRGGLIEDSQSKPRILSDGPRNTAPRSPRKIKVFVTKKAQTRFVELLAHVKYLHVVNINPKPSTTVGLMVYAQFRHVEHNYLLSARFIPSLTTHFLHITRHSNVKVFNVITRQRRQNVGRGGCIYKEDTLVTGTREGLWHAACTAGTQTCSFVIFPLVIDQLFSTGANTQIGKDWPPGYAGMLHVSF